MRTKHIARTAVAAAALLTAHALIETRETQAAFYGTIFRSLCGSSGQPMNPLVATGIDWTVPTDDDSLCKVTQTALDPSFPQAWLIHFPAERTNTLLSTPVTGRALVFGGAFPVNNVCATLITFRQNGTRLTKTVPVCTTGTSSSTQTLTMVPASLSAKGAIVMRFDAFGGASIVRGDVEYRTEGTGP